MSRAGSGEVLALGDCLFDRARGLLLRNDEPVALRPKAFALLDHLAANCGRVVGKSDLIAAVWPGVFVTEDSLTQAIRELRKALADDDQRTVRTVARRGYLLAPSDTRTKVAERQPAVAILRFTNEGDAGNEPVVDGFTEDVMSGLARFRTVTLLARNSSFAFASDACSNWQAVGRQLGADYLVRGRIKLSAGLLEARVSLIESAGGAVLWSDAFAASGNGIFALQEEIALKVVNRLVTRLHDASLSRSAAKPPASLAAYEMLQRGLMRLRGYGEENNLAAKAFFEQALTKDPNYALAHSYIALTDLFISGFGEAPPDVIASIVNRADLAVTLAPEESRCQRVLGLAHLFARHHEAAEYHVRRAFDLNPFDADTIAQMAYVLTMRGRPVEALGWFDRAVRINPIHPDWYHSDRGIALYAAGEYAEALASFSRVPAQTPWRIARLASCHAQLGHQEQARRLMTEVRCMAPDFSPLDIAHRFLVYEHAADADHVAEGIAKALAA
jgi:DNA-binding winged helix-turn-helix (wHTH) protein/Tfp pilus assembly protein PilF